MEASNSTNPLFLYADTGALTNKALKILGSDYTNLPYGESLTTRIAVILRNFFRAINCTTIKHSLNNFFINRAVTIIKNQNCQFVKDTFNINSDFHGWCLIEQILGDYELKKRSLIKKGSHFEIIKNIYEDFKEGDKPYFKIAFNLSNSIDQIELFKKYHPKELAAKELALNADHENSSSISSNGDEDSSMTEIDSDSENEISEREEKVEINDEVSKEESKSVEDRDLTTLEEVIQKRDEVNPGTKEQTVDTIINENNEPSLIVNADDEEKPSDSDLNKEPNIDAEKNEFLPEAKESKENSDKPIEQKETTKPKVEIKSSKESKNTIQSENLSTNNHTVQKDPLASPQKKRSTKSHRSEKKPAIELEAIDQIQKAFKEEPILTGLNLLGDFLAPFLNKTDLDIVKKSLQQTANLLKQHYVTAELAGEAKIKQDLKANTLEVINQLKSEDFKNLLSCLGKENKLTDKTLISGSLNTIKNNTTFLKSLAQKSVAVVENMYLLEQLHVADKNKGNAWYAINVAPKLLSEKIQDIYSKLNTVFAPITPTKFALKAVLSSKLQDKVSEKGLQEIDNAIAPFIDIFVDHWDQIEDKYQIFAHLKQFEALALKMEKKPFFDSEAATELNKLLELTFDKNLDAFYGPLNEFLNPFLNAEHS